MLLKPIQVRGLYDGGVVNIAAVQVHWTVDTGYTPGTAVLPNSKWHLAPAVVVPVGNPELVVAESADIEHVTLPVEAGVESGVVAGRPQALQERQDNFRALLVGEFSLALVLEVNKHRVLPLCAAQAVNEKVSLEVSLVRVGGVAVMIGADGHTDGLRARNVVPQLAVCLLIPVHPAVACTNNRELHARILNGLPIYISIVVRDVNAALAKWLRWLWCRRWCRS